MPVDLGGGVAGFGEVDLGRGVGGVGEVEPWLLRILLSSGATN